MGKPLKTFYTGRLRPIMRAYKQPLPEGEWGGPIPSVPLRGMGNYEGNVQTVDPRGSELWSNLYRIGTAGALSRVAPFGPAAFGTDNDSNSSAAGSVLPLLAVLGIGVAAVYMVWK